jgi:tartrate-resistant acid phosphatase type 5
MPASILPTQQPQLYPVQVSNMLNRWDRESSVSRLDALLTTGDNNYPVGAMDVMDNVVGQYYSKFMYPYSGRHQSATDSINRFWPVPGNHDWTDKCGSGSSLAPYLTYMPVNNKSYYDVVIADVHFFMLDSDCNEPDGYTATSTQAGWLQTKLSESTSRWKLVLLHHPPYSSGAHGSQARSQWPFKAWGADAVIAGHDHNYERIVRHGGFPYFINGLGGKDHRSFTRTVVSGSMVSLISSGNIHVNV